MNQAPEENESGNGEASRFLREHGDIESADLLIADLNGILRGKVAPAKSLLKAGDPGINLPLSIFGLDVWGREVDSTGLHIASGDRDGFCRAIPGRITRTGRSGKPSAQVLMRMVCDDGSPFAVDPRSEEGLRTLENVFQLELALAKHPPLESIGTRVYVRFDHGSIAARGERL